MPAAFTCPYPDGAYPSGVGLSNFGDTWVVGLQLPAAIGAVSQFVVFGRVIIDNRDGSSQPASARLTTYQGQTELDRVDVTVGGQVGESISLQGTVRFPNKDPIQFPVVEIHCATYDGLAHQATLLAIPVDEVQIACTLPQTSP